MRVSNINSTEPSMKGYLHKSVYRYINNASRNAKNDLQGIRSAVPKGQFEAAIRKIELAKKTAIANLESFIKKCHAKSYLIMEEHYGYATTMKLNNKNMKLDYSIPGASLLKLDGIFKNEDIITPTREHSMPQLFGGAELRLGDIDLYQIERFSEKLIQINPKSADKAVLKNFSNQVEHEHHSFFGNMAKKRKIRKIENFAREIGA